MNPTRPTYHSKIYREFRAIESNEWRTIRRFYEEYEAQIRQLEFEEYFELLLAYTNALFEIGPYEKHLLMADTVIETSISNNIKFFHGEDVFQHTLFKKAASCYHTYRLEQADYILRELLRIDPFDADAALFLKKCLRKMNPSLVRTARAMAMVLFFASALVILVEMLAVRIFYPMYTDTFELTRNSLFLLGLAAIAGGHLLHRWRSVREVDNFVEVLKRRRR